MQGRDWCKEGWSKDEEEIRRQESKHGRGKDDMCRVHHGGLERGMTKRRTRSHGENLRVE